MQTVPDPAVPFRGRLEGLRTHRIQLDPPFVLDQFDMAGNATRLGRFDLEITAIVNFGAVPPFGVGTYSFVAANGDALVANFTGYSEPVGPGVVLLVESALIDPDSSTGRFAGATGSFLVLRLLDIAGGTTVGSFDGTTSRPGR